EFLIRVLLAELKQKLQRPELLLRADVISDLLAYAWPGNVRELVNVLAFAEANSCDDVITLADLPELLQSDQSASVAGARETSHVLSRSMMTTG
ncbi:sigma-54-dependent Fis family transcriptional regulator, partial [Oceanobacter sp. 2_MG-2023]|nr:sigma-54-dependent Fis family transcriptional regulator [Oceanobacter sp. 2_MG-2023]